MKNHLQSWQRLAAAARAAEDPRDVHAPLGFAVRVAAQAMAAPRSGLGGAWEKFALRGLLAACGLCLAAIAYNYTGGSGSVDHEDDVTSVDTVGEILDLSS